MIRKRFFACLILLFQFVTVSAYQTKNVIVVVIDGARYTETFGDSTHQYIPHMWNELQPLGSLYTAFYNDGTTSTNPGHASILTGTWQTIANNGTERPHAPTLFEYFRKQTGLDSNTAFVVLGKSKLSILAYSDFSGYGRSFGASVRYSSNPYDDMTTWNNLISVLQSEQPRVVIVNLAATDYYGHSGNWNNYVNAIKTADQIVADLWQLLQKLDAYQGKTTLFVTNDHGRHTGNFTSHGDGCEGCRHILLLMLGPDTPAGMIDSTKYEQIDIAPTAAELLQIQAPYTEGHVISSAMVTDVSSFSETFPQQFQLLQNYPNPFREQTSISFTVGNDQIVTLMVISATGRIVRILHSGVTSAGFHFVLWDGRDTFGKPAASGVYFVKLYGRNTGRTEIRKMIFLR